MFLDLRSRVDNDFDLSDPENTRIFFTACALRIGDRVNSDQT
jgi:hypothetical protein